MGLYVRESRPEAAETIVFLHGGGISGWMWQPQVELLNDYHCLVPDLPEHGRSIEVRPFTIKRAAEMVAELIRKRAHGGRAHVVGLSLGGQITLQLLSAFSDLVDHAVVSGTLVRPIRGTGLLGALYRAYAPFKDIGFLVRANMPAAGIPDRYFPEVREDTRLLTSDSFRDVMAGMSFGIPAGLDSVTRPTLVAVGQKERKVVRQSAFDILATMPNAKGCVAPNVGHAWNLQEPDLFSDMVRAWVSDGPLPRELPTLP